MLIAEYMRRLDSPVPRTAMELVEANVRFVLSLPSGRVEGNDRDALWAYVDNRPPVVRRHHVARELASRDLEAVYGFVTDDDVETGAFFASARLSDSGLMQRYLVHFDATFRLIDGH